MAGAIPEMNSISLLVGSVEVEQKSPREIDTVN